MEVIHKDCKDHIDTYGRKLPLNASRRFFKEIAKSTVKINTKKFHQLSGNEPDSVQDAIVKV